MDALPTSGPRATVLVTGSAGDVATLIAPALRPVLRLRRLDVVAQRAELDDEVVEADVRDVDAVAAACDGVRAVIHLAAQRDEAHFRSLLLPKNVEGAWSAFEAAVRAGVPRFVFASSIQVVDGNEAGIFVLPAMPPRPVSVYGCTKVFGEALGRYHSDVSGLGVVCVRLGAVRSPDDPRLRTDEAFRHLWCGPSDVARLLIAAIQSDVRFATVIAVSPPATERFDTSNPFGWTPVETPLGM